MSGRGRTEFLERGTYRQRRLRDAARILPIFATILILLPLLWPWERDGGIAPSVTTIYLFGLWLALVLISAVLTRLIKYDDPAEEEPER